MQATVIGNGPSAEYCIPRSKNIFTSNRNIAQELLSEYDVAFVSSSRSTLSLDVELVRLARDAGFTEIYVTGIELGEKTLCNPSPKSYTELREDTEYLKSIVNYIHADVLSGLYEAVISWNGTKEHA